MNRRADPAPSGRDRLLADYALQPGVADELFDASGAMRPVWREMIDHLAALSPDEIAEHFARANAYLREAGVYFRQYSNEPSAEREWPLSHLPVMIHESEWTTICEGLAQRADLLEAVMADLYGPGDLVRNGHLPAELVARNPQWLRPLVGVRPASGHFLHFLSFEISRNPDGSWFVLGDRTQAPSGAGFALENRMATMRIFHEPLPLDRVHRLAGFFSAFRETIEATHATRGRRSAILTPGPNNAGYFEHTYIARYLGLMLLEGEDMTVQNGEVMVRTIEGPKPLGALWRRLDSDFADPLELREDSRLGTPGLVNAVRLGNLSVINALGSGVLEMRALMAFLPKISEVLTGAPLRLPNIATWWCGQRAERDYVLANTAKMMIGEALSNDLPFDIGATTALGGEFRGEARPSIDAWIEEEGARLVGQEAVTLSTSPAYHKGRLVPLPMTVRVMAARTGGGWSFMPGGYARIGLEGDATALAMQRGGSVADVWVVGDGPAPRAAMLTDGGLHPVLQSVLPSRAADNLYWLGRYIERAEGAIRLVRAYQLRLAETGDPDDPRLVQLDRYMAAREISTVVPMPQAIASLVGSARSCAAKLRDRFSMDGWAALEDLDETARSLRATTRPGDDCARAMSMLRRKITGFTGLVHDNMYRTAGWRFLSFGRALERAEGMAAMLAAFADTQAPPGALDMVVELGDSVMTFRQRYRTDANRVSVIDLLALDPMNPRSILFQVDRMLEIADELPQDAPGQRMSALARALLPLKSRLAVTDPRNLASEDLEGIRKTLAEVSDLLSSRYLG